ncbi:MAG: agmatinase [Phycisphaerae bacterium]
MAETVPNNFLGLESKYCQYQTARFAVLPIPYEATTSFGSGTRQGPQAIVTASQQVELFDEELLTECHKTGIATLDPLMPNAAGPEAMHEDIFRAAKRIVRDGKFLLALGGEHSITSGLVRAVAGKHKKLSILQIDAHLDLRDQYQQSPYSHACVMRRCLPFVEAVVPVGIRNLCAQEHRFCRKAGIDPITARQCLESDDWVDRVLDGLTDNVYVTLDIDGFDPAFAPGTGTPEPGGLDWYQVIGLLRLVCAEKNVVAADVVEVMPLPGQSVTEFLAARLAYKLMGYVVGKDRL